MFVAQSTDKPVFNKKRKRSKEKARVPDPDRVKRVAQPFIFFSNKHRREVMDANPTLKTGEVSKVLGRMWRDLPEAGRAEYFALHEQDKVRYAHEVQARANAQGEDSTLMFQLAMAVPPHNTFVADSPAKSFAATPPPHPSAFVDLAMGQLSQQSLPHPSPQYAFPPPHSSASQYANFPL